MLIHHTERFAVRNVDIRYWHPGVQAQDKMCKLKLRCWPCLVLRYLIVSILHKILTGIIKETYSKPLKTETFFTLLVFFYLFFFSHLELWRHQDTTFNEKRQETVYPKANFGKTLIDSILKLFLKKEMEFLAKHFTNR